MSRHLFQVRGERWKQWENEERESESEVEQGSIRKVQPEWKADAVAARDGTRVENTEEKVGTGHESMKWRTKAELFTAASGK